MPGGVSKVVLADGTTLIDLTGDTVVADVLLQGYTATGKDGAKILGALQMAGSDKYVWFRQSDNTYVQTTPITAVMTLGTSGGVISYATDISINGDGTVSLVNARTVTLTNSNAGITTLANAAPCYISGMSGGATGEILYLPSGIRVGTSASYGLYYSKGTSSLSGSATIRANTIAIIIQRGSIELAFANDRNAYPDLGTQDGYFYEFRGEAAANGAGALKFHTGSYVGTGTYGATSKNALIFDFVPRLFICMNEVLTSGSSVMQTMTWIEGVDTTTAAIHFEQSGLTLRWYSTSNAYNQMNGPGLTYRYIAIG